MKEIVLDFKKVGGLNVLGNLLLISEYLSYGGPIIIKDKTCDKPGVVFFDKTGEPCYWIFGDRYIDIDTALIRLYTLIQKESIESFTFFVEDLYCMFKASNIGRKHYIKETYEDSVLNINLRHHVTFTREEFINVLQTQPDSNGIDGIVNLFNIDNLAFMESSDEVNKLLDRI